MSTLVPSDDERKGHVGPPVFTKGPTDEEVEALHDAVRSARGSRNLFAILTLVLLGALVASVAGVSWIQSTSDEEAAAMTERLEAKDEQIADLNEQVGGLQGEVDDLEAELSDYLEYSIIETLQSRITELNAEIDGLLAEDVRSDAPQDIREFGEEPPQWKDRVERELQAYVEKLEAHRDRVEAFPRPVRVRPDSPVED
jgi:hypothetical protein